MENFNTFSNIVNHTNFTILSVDFIKLDSSWQHYNITSPFNRLYFVKSGSGMVYNKTNNIKLQPGNVYLIPAFSTFNYVCQDYVDKFYIHFNYELIPGQDLFKNIKDVLITKNNYIDFNLMNFDKELIVKDFYNLKLQLEHSIIFFMNNYVKNININENLFQKYSKIFKIIDNNYYNNIQVKFFSDMLNMSESNFSKQFKKDFKISIKSYLNERLIKKAKEYLLITNKKIKEIAFILNFNDEYYFSRFFKKHTNFSPIKYREKNKM